MTKISKNERDLATNMVLWFVGHSGEMGIDSLARLTEADEFKLKAWATSERLLWEGGESLSISALPLVWVAFASQSRTCQALAEAFNNLKGRAKKGSLFQAWVKECETDCTLVTPIVGPTLL